MRLILLLIFMQISLLKAQPAPPERPAVVVAVAVDQMRWDYLYRFYDRYGDGGFKRLLKQGFSYENCNIPYVPAVTSAGHASLFTGTVPAFHGITGNEWVDRRSGLLQYCNGDSSVLPLGGSFRRSRISPVNLLATTIGDELRLATNMRSRVFGVALKDRGAVLSPGRSANAAYWFDDSTGNWVSSTYYMKDLPGWVKDYNGLRKPDSLLKLKWELYFPNDTYLNSTRDNASWEKPFNHEKEPVFPHTFERKPGDSYAALGYSPQANWFTFDFSREVILNEKIGLGKTTDMLCISISATDILGHKTGPNSMEVEDMMIRLDRQLADFLLFLDKQYGEGNYLFFLSSDHGAGHSPDFFRSQNLSAGVLKMKSLKEELNGRLRQKFGIEPVSHIQISQIYLNRPMIDSAGISRKSVEAFVVDFFRLKDEVLDVFAFDDLHAHNIPASVREMFVNGYYAKRCGDIQVILKPQYSYNSSTGSDHFSWYNYDTRLPLIFFGWGIKPGSSFREVQSIDVAPTVAAMLRIQSPNASIGKVLEEVVR